MANDSERQSEANDPGDQAEVEPTIHEATLASGCSGAVLWGVQLSFQEAVLRRQRAEDVVVRGHQEVVNRRLAGEIERAVGPATRPQPPHTYSAGDHALPHFHQVSRVPDGHTFYETKNPKRKARKKR